MRIGLYIILCGLLLSAPVSAQSEADSSPSVFEGYIGESIWTLIWFAVLLLVLWRFAWKPILASLTSRQEYIERQIADAEKIRAEAKKVLAEYQAKLADADRQGREIINARVKEAQSQAMEVQQAAQREIEQMKLRAEAELQRERQEAEDALWEQAGEIILQLGKEVFGKALDEEDNRRLIEQAIDRLRSQPANVETHRQF